MSSQEHFHIMQLLEFIMIDCDESQLLQALALSSIVDNVAQTIERSALLQFLFCLFDSCGHTEAES